MILQLKEGSVIDVENENEGLYWFGVGDLICMITSAIIIAWLIEYTLIKSVAMRTHKKECW